MAAEKERVPLRVLVGRRLREAAQQLDGEAVGDPLVVARLQHVLGVSLRESGHLEQAEWVLVKAARTRVRLLGADHLETVATQHHDNIGRPRIAADGEQRAGKHDCAQIQTRETQAGDRNPERDAQPLSKLRQVLSKGELLLL